MTSRNLPSQSRLVLAVVDECDAPGVRICFTDNQESGPIRKKNMHKQVVEYAGVPVGILVPRDDSLTFLAVKYNVIGLDGKRFTSLSDARSAIHSHVSRRDMLAA